MVGFALRRPGSDTVLLWITGDTVLLRGRCGERAAAMPVDVALVHVGGVRFPITGPLRYTMTAREAVELIGAGPAAGRGARALRGLVALQDGRAARSGRSPPRRPTYADGSAGCRSGPPPTSHAAQ